MAAREPPRFKKRNRKSLEKELAELKRKEDQVEKEYRESLDYITTERSSSNSRDKGKGDDTTQVSDDTLRQLRYGYLSDIHKKRKKLLEEFEDLDPDDADWTEEMANPVEHPPDAQGDVPPVAAVNPKAPPPGGARQANNNGQRRQAVADPSRAASNRYPMRGGAGGAGGYSSNGQSQDITQAQELVVHPFIPLEQPPMKLLTTISIYGKRRSGKSVWVKWFCQHIKSEFPYIYVFTKTKINNFYRTFIPENYIFDHLSERKLRYILARQEKAIEMYHKDPELNPRTLVIIDDENENIRYNKTLDRFYFHGRHLGIMILLCAQHWSITPPAVRYGSHNLFYQG